MYRTNQQPIDVNKGPHISRSSSNFAAGSLLQLYHFYFEPILPIRSFGEMRAEAWIAGPRLIERFPHGHPSDQSRGCPRLRLV